MSLEFATPLPKLFGNVYFVDFGVGAAKAGLSCSVQPSLSAVTEAIQFSTERLDFRIFTSASSSR